jgi:hypothetical protein
LQIRLIDPLGQVRYDLYRATDRGSLRIDLPLAANDPAGQWTLEVRELLSGKTGSATFAYQPAAQCAAAAGATPRAVYFGDDRDHVFRLFRTHQDFTIVVGKGDYEAAAARIAEIIKPWGAECRIVKAADVKVNHPSDEALKTWSGLGFGRVDPKNPSPALVGYDLRGPAILLGNSADNELIKFADEHGFLPYKADARDFPGRGRGYIAWQRDAVSYGAESVTLIGYDPAGISEAVGTFYEAVAGIEPLTKYDLPTPATITCATARTIPPEATVVWRARVPDRVVSLATVQGQIVVASADGSSTGFDADGKILSKALAKPAAQNDAPEPAIDLKSLEKVAVPGRIAKRVTTDKGLTAIGYWGGTVQIVDDSGATKSLQVLPGDVGDMVWLNGKLVVGLADGTVVAMEVNPVARAARP